jgi:hypothetical protein
LACVNSNFRQIQCLTKEEIAWQPLPPQANPIVVLVGAGIMSATLAVFLKHSVFGQTDSPRSKAVLG